MKIEDEIKNRMKEVDELVSEVITNDDLLVQTNSPEFQEIRSARPEDWKTINNIFTGEITKMKHVMLKINTYYRDLAQDYLQVQNRLENVSSNTSTESTIEIKGIKAKIRDLRSIFLTIIFTLCFILILIFSLAKFDTSAFDSVVTAIEKITKVYKDPQGVDTNNKNIVTKSKVKG